MHTGRPAGIPLPISWAYTGRPTGNSMRYGVHREPAAWCTQGACSIGVHREPAAWVYTGRPAAVYQHYGPI